MQLVTLAYSYILKLSYSEHQMRIKIGYYHRYYYCYYYYTVSRKMCHFSFTDRHNSEFLAKQ